MRKLRTCAPQTFAARTDRRGRIASRLSDERAEEMIRSESVPPDRKRARGTIVYRPRDTQTTPRPSRYCWKADRAREPLDRQRDSARARRRAQQHPARLPRVGESGILRQRRVHGRQRLARLMVAIEVEQRLRDDDSAMRDQGRARRSRAAALRGTSRALAVRGHRPSCARRCPRVRHAPARTDRGAQRCHAGAGGLRRWRRARGGSTAHARARTAP